MHSNEFLESVKRWPIFKPILKWRGESQLAKWEAAGRPVPPHHFNKRRVLREMGEKYGLRTLVETGTFRGDMIEAMRPHFDRLFSIELSKELHGAAVRRFAKYPQIQIIHGDSAIELSKLVSTLDGPSLFWLDGHYSGGVTAHGEDICPIYLELEPIFQTWERGHVVVIDDARLFVPDTGYPLIETLTEFVHKHLPEAIVEVVDDGIRILPSR